MTSQHTVSTLAAGADAGAPAQVRASGRHHLGEDLRRLRRARSLPLAAVAATLEVAPSTLSRIETGQAPVKAAYLRLLLDLYGVNDEAERARFADLARDGWRKSWHHGYRHLLPAGASQYLDLETAATQVRSYSVQAMPDLAQTPGYAAAALRAARPGLTGAQVGDLVTVQRRRQELARSGSVRLHLVIDESVLLRLVGTAGVMAGQLSHLLALAADPAVTVQVAALARPLPALTVPFTILSFSGPRRAGVACHPGVDSQITIARRRDELRALHRAFTALARTAMSPADTASLIKDTAAHWEQAQTP